MKDKRRAIHLFSILANQKHLKIPETVEDFRICLALSLSFPIPFVSIAGVDVYHDDLGYKAYDQFLEIFSGDQDIARHFTIGSISTTAKKYIVPYIEDALQGHPKAITGKDAFENILSELSSSPDEIEVHFLVNGLLLDDIDSIRLGKLTFGKIDHPYVEKLFPTIDFSKRDDKSICPPPSKDRQLEIEAGILAKRKSLFGLTMAKVVGRGDIWRSRQEAYRECKITLGALSIYPIIFTYESNRRQMIRFSTSGMSRQEFGPLIGYNTKNQTRTFTLGGLPWPPPFHLKSEYIGKFQEFGWDNVSKFLQDRTENDEIDRALETSLFWLGEAVGETLTASAITKYFTAIESLIIGPRVAEQIVKRVATRISVLIGQSPDDAREIKRKIEKSGGLYDLRSQVAHAGKSEFEDNTKIFETGALASWVFLNFLKARGVPSLDQAISMLDINAEVVFRKESASSQTRNSDSEKSD